jgi:glycerate-2-kinase
MPVTSDPRTLLERLYRGAVRAARPDVALRAALDRASRPVHQRVHCLAIGKAAPAMARATLEWRAASALHGVVGGVCVAAVAPHEPATLAPLELHVGDHPVPAAASLAAAARLGHYIETQVHGGDHVIVCLSGGTSSLIAAPLPGLAPDDITALGHALLHAGLPIDAINRVRRRVHRWGGGRLATAIGARAASASTYLVSDVLGDTLPSIGSGPCTADPVPRHEVLALLERISGAPARVRAWVVADRDDARMPASDDPRARHVTQEIIASSGTLAGAAQGEATRVGLHVDMSVARITGDAHEAGRGFATALLAARERRERRGTRAAPLLRVAVGEPVVHVTDPSRALGGRMQAFALAAAELLHDAGDAAAGLHLLCAGSDGRDGPTDAAGAIVDRHTWGRIRAAGHAPERALAEQRSYVALDAVDATIRAFDSGTNVNDLVLGLDLGG